MGASLCQDGSLNLEEEVQAEQAGVVACQALSPLQTPSPIYDWLTLVSCSNPRYLSRLESAAGVEDSASQASTCSDSGSDIGSPSGMVTPLVDPDEDPAPFGDN